MCCVNVSGHCEGRHLAFPEHRIAQTAPICVLLGLPCNSFADSEAGWGGPRSLGAGQSHAHTSQFRSRIGDVGDKVVVGYAIEPRPRHATWSGILAAVAPYEIDKLQQRY